MIVAQPASYSARVTICLLIDGTTDVLDVWSVSPTHVVFKPHQPSGRPIGAYPPGTRGILRVEVDSSRLIRGVAFPDGINPDRYEVRMIGEDAIGATLRSPAD
jgi:hypothetical protein